ncbi:MAG TPA: zf-TFIIB domain-containing protein [Polyangiaceae bacterium]|nr:zf-TFIIB domain-containing protein [Polyangiaceae bacterium]
MQEALAFRCPICGGPTEAAARRCEYCRSALATLRCAACFHLNPGNAKHCGGCGFELGLEPLATTSTLHCPSCSAAMEALSEAAGTLYVCGSCEGQFVEHRLMSALVERQERVQTELVTGPPRAKHIVGSVAYRACPICSALMWRKNFGARSGVIVDVCARHGSFMDPGELPDILTFVSRGGLERERREKADQARKKDVALRALPESRDPQNPLELSLSELGLADVVQFFRNLLGRGPGQ